MNFKVKIIIVIEPDENGFHAYCPALEGLHTDGDTEQEALQNAKDAATAYLSSLIKHDDPIPVGIIVSKKAETIPSISEYPVSYIEDLAIAVA
ncbi:MAG: type II toxin-antitoxin system HicB family antitoxin [Campylobacterota bacterium]|nr:type II toxin-antitoxin system HicB family antitoxin [Campylobacterota bacterium]